MSEPVQQVQGEVFLGVDGAHRVNLHHLRQIYLTPTEAQTIAREINQYAIDAMRADGEREESL